MRRSLVREPVRVLFHLSGGYTKVFYDRAAIAVDIPTNEIPAHLRKIGSHFILSFHAVSQENADSIEDLRAAAREKYTIEEIR